MASAASAASETRPRGPEDTLENVVVLVVHDAADQAKAAELGDALQPYLAEPLRKVSSPELAAGDAKVAVVLVSKDLEKNGALVAAVAAKLPNALVPVIVDSRMVLQKNWYGELSRSMANGLHFAFRIPNASKISDIAKEIQTRAHGKPRDGGWDVFLSHEWGVHSKAREIKNRLECDHALKVWLDEKEVSDSIDGSMADGIEGSKVFLVLATKRYMKKVNDGDRADNCLKEFRHAGNQRSDRIVVAALEVEMCNAATEWSGEFHLGLSLQTPVKVCSLSEGEIKRLAEEIRRRINMPEPSSHLTPLMRDIFPRLNPCNSEAWARGRATKFRVGTRSWILSEVDKWYESNHSPVFVLVSDGGVGKSVIMAEICSRGGVLKDEGARLEKGVKRTHDGNTERPAIPVVAYHFFRHDEGTAASPKEALLSVAWQLCKNVEGFAGEIEQTTRITSFRDKTLADIFQTLLIGPLQKLRSDQARQVVVLDALDECNESDTLLDKVMRPWKEAMPPWLSLVVSTRPEGDIIRGLDNNCLDRTVLKRRDKENFRDIGLYVEHLLQDMSDIVEQRDVKDSAQILKARSEGLFLWASFLGDTLRHAQKAKGVGSLLTKDDIEKEDVIPAGLGGMFKEYFGRLQAKLGSLEIYRKLLEPIVAAREPLSVEQISRILGLDEEETWDIVDDARNLLHIGDDRRVALIHKRMASWLSDRDQSGKLRVSVKEGHQRLAAYCRDHGDDDEFALRHAVYHLVKNGDKAGAFALLNDFSWMQRVISSGTNWVQRHDTIDALLRDCAEAGMTSAPETDTPWLLDQSHYALSRDPYVLASLVWARLFDEGGHPLMKSFCEPPRPWLQPVRASLAHPGNGALVGHSGIVSSVAVDGDVVVSGSADKTVCIWNASTGKLQHTLRGHTDKVRSVAIDGKRVVSGSDDRTVRIWNASTGSLLVKHVGHSDVVMSVAVEGSRVVSGSSDRTVRIWSAETGKERVVLKGHSGAVNTVAIYGDRVISGSDDKTVRIWNAMTDEVAQLVLNGHSYSVSSIAVDLRRVDFRSDDEIDKNWRRLYTALVGLRPQTLSSDDIKETDDLIRELHYGWYAHPDELESLTLHEHRIVSKDSEGAVCVWDADSGDLLFSREWDSVSPIMALLLLPFEVKNHVRLCHDIVFTTDSTIRSTARSGNTVVLGDEDGLVHILQYRKL